MTAIGGTPELVAEVERNGGESGPVTTWVTPGVERWGLDHLDAFFADCRRNNDIPLILFWIWGDHSSPKNIENGVDDKYQRNMDGSPIRITTEKAVGWAHTIAAKAKGAGVVPIFAIEHEFAQNDTEKIPGPYAAYFDRVHAAIKAAHPPSRVAFCVPVWADPALILKNFKPQIEKADLIGGQTLLFLPRHPRDQFVGAGQRLKNQLEVMRGSKPVAVVDFGFSSYGGRHTTGPPFSGGDGRANEELQRQAIASLAILEGLKPEFLAYRALRDDPKFNTGNYGGWAERFVGVSRADASRKPAYAALMALAAPRTFSAAEYQAAVDRASRAEEALAKAQKDLAGMSTQHQDLQGRLERGLAALQGR